MHKKGASMSGDDEDDKQLPLPDPDQQKTDEKISVITVNFKDGKIVNKVQFEDEGGIWPNFPSKPRSNPLLS
jgi:hypothetical protein